MRLDKKTAAKAARWILVLLFGTVFALLMLNLRFKPLTCEQWTEKYGKDASWLHCP